MADKTDEPEEPDASIYAAPVSQRDAPILGRGRVSTPDPLPKQRWEDIDRAHRERVEQTIGLASKSSTASPGEVASAKGNDNLEDSNKISKSSAGSARSISDRDFTVAVTIFGCLLAAGLYALYEQKWFFGTPFTTFGILGLLSMSPLVRSKIRVPSRFMLWIAVCITWLFLAANVAISISEKIWPPNKPSSVIGFTQKQVDEKIAAATESLNKQLAEANRQKNTALRDAELLRGKIQNVPTRAPAPEEQMPINWQPDFQLNWYADQKIAWLRFTGVSTAMARIKDAYITSTLTGRTVKLDVANATNFTERWKVDQVEPIPTGAQVILVYEPKPPPPIADFLRQWGAFEFHVVYENKEYVKTYSQDYINSKLTRDMPGVFGPRVTPRNDK